jgi:hypothetical protein
MVDRFEQTLDEPPSSVKSLEEVEKEHIISVLEHSGWRIEGLPVRLTPLASNPVPSAPAWPSSAYNGGS